MGTIAEKAHEYFASMGPLAKKVLQESEAVKNQHGNEWESLTIEQQDELLDNYFVDPKVREMYPNQSNLPSCYPKLKINCGEKIVVDFDNDGWTWQDEHSGPFSWYSKSEQDLSILDLEDVSVPEKEKKKGKKGKGKKKGKKPRPPPPPPPDGIHPEKSIWESPFLTADRGLDSNYSMEDAQMSVEDEADQTEDDEKPEAPNINITLSPSKTSIPHAQVAIDEETKLLDSSFEYGAESQLVITAEVEEKVAPPRTKGKKRKEAPKKAPPPPPVNKNKNNNKLTVDSAETLMTDLSINTAPSPPRLFRDADGGQLSPVYLEEPGESSTDVVVTQQPASTFSFSNTETSQGGQVNLALDEDDWRTPSQAEQKDDQPVKTGFDFLDNW